MDEFYFFTDPDEFIYNHLPQDEGWQLLARPVTKDEFQVLANLIYLVHGILSIGLNSR